MVALPFPLVTAHKDNMSEIIYLSKKAEKLREPFKCPKTAPYMISDEDRWPAYLSCV